MDEILKSQLLDTEVEYDPGVDDPWAQPAPPPDGRHQALIMLGRPAQGTEEAIQVKRQRKEGESVENASGDPYIQVPVALKILAPGSPEDGLMVFDNANSLRMRNGTTRIHEILKACGNPAPARVKLSQLVEMVEQTLGGESTTVEIETQWKAQVEVEDKKSPTGKGYKTLKTGMKNFPRNPDGIGYNHRIEAPTGEEVAAKAEVKGYYQIG